MQTVLDFISLFMPQHDPQAVLAAVLTLALMHRPPQVRADN